ncbi:hypothetical protein [Sagittula stellata]|uniref:Uncharacterized protein n=1 Tax=Sagittula stellata (strain ATCC 700073 / DSM 11524 / E-37) TaxID=388399 RepID=A3K262_SAGS3|nr:hypothetical protein [Sagittula stellata]EBA09008.1 hypothetical protein SSE37_05160 [Sagittula stellata E-37]
MAKSLDGLMCGLRISLAGALAYTASEHFILPPQSPDALLLQGAHAPLVATILSGLLWLIAASLMFGVRTRMVAALGLTTYAAMALLLPGLDRMTAQPYLSAAIVACLALPVILAGGGDHSLVRGGWRAAL